MRIAGNCERDGYATIRGLIPREVALSPSRQIQLEIEAAVHSFQTFARAQALSKQPTIAAMDFLAAVVILAELPRAETPMHETPVQRLRFRDLPGPDRLALLHDEFGPAINACFDPFDDRFDMEFELLAFPGVAVLHGMNTPTAVWTHDLSRENDDLILVWHERAGKGRTRHLGRDVNGADAVGFLASGCDPYRGEMHCTFFPAQVRMSRARLATLLPHAESLLMRPVPISQPAFALLRGYLQLLRQNVAECSPEMLIAAADHICDLVALTVGTTRDATAFAAGRGLRAARFAAVREWACERLREPSISVEGAAQAHGISTRYIQQLFAEHDTSFSKFVLAKRLALARRDLADPAQRHFSISDIAFECGFGDLSHFNRSFRAAFGMTPTDARQLAIES